MKHVSKGAEPQPLATFRQNNPAGTWIACKRNPARLQEIQQRLKEDQADLCAYCEIDLRPVNPASLPDFRVEHFHPKSDTADNTNWHLDWQNLLGCCHGGSQSGVPERHTSPDHSCDVPKANQNLDNIILNPLKLPLSRLFSFSRVDGAMTMDVAACQAAGVDVTRANQTITELHLDGARLRHLRKEELNRVNEKLVELMKTGLTVGEARDRLVKALLTKDNQGRWPAFFSALRHYLGDAAETHLNATGYNG